ncbi:hypothetical protein [Bacillus sp. JCM 19041]
MRAGLLYLINELSIQEGHLYLLTAFLTREASALLSSPREKSMRRC